MVDRASDSDAAPGGRGESEWELLASVPTRQEAQLLAGLLESAGIRSHIESLLFTQEPVNFGLLGTVRVWVVREQLRDAERLVEQQQAQASEPEQT